MDNTDNVEAKDGVLHIKPTLLEDKFGQDFARTGNLALKK